MEERKKKIVVKEDEDEEEVTKKPLPKNKKRIIDEEEQEQINTLLSGMAKEFAKRVHVEEDEEVTMKKPKKVANLIQDEEVLTLSAQMQMKEKEQPKVQAEKKLGISIVENNEKEPLQIPHAKLLKIIKDQNDDNDFIFYKGKRIIHKKILQEYVAELGDDQLGSIIKRATGNQKIILTSSEEINPLQDADQLQIYLKSHSIQYSACAGAFELARGGEAVVYRVEHYGLDEIVAKCTIFTQDTPFESIKSSYSTLFYETQTLKMMEHPNYMAEIKEEIIELNVEKQLITRYCVIVERAQKTLGDIVSTWTNQENLQHRRESFTPEKLAYYFFQAMKGLQYCHDNHLYYGDMKTANLLVFREQLCKIGDLGISIKLDFRDQLGNEAKYCLKGATPGFLPQNVEASLETGELLDKKTLYRADLYALQVTFQRTITRLAQFVTDIQAAFDSACTNKGFSEKNYPYSQNAVSEDRLTYFVEMANDLKLYGLKRSIEKWRKVLKEDSDYQLELASCLLNQEYKYEAVMEVFELSRFKVQLQEIQKEFDSLDKFEELSITELKGREALDHGFNQVKGFWQSISSQKNFGLKLVQGARNVRGIWRKKDGDHEEEKKNMEERIEKLREMEDEKKKLQTYLHLIEEDELGDLHDEQKAKKKQLEHHKSEKWDSFYSSLTEAEKLEWRRIAILLIKTYQSDRSNQFYQRYLEILIQSEEEGKGNLYFGKKKQITHRDIQKYAKKKKKALQAIAEDENMFGYVLDFLMLTSTDITKIWEPLVAILQDYQGNQKFMVHAKLGMLKSYNQLNKMEEIKQLAKEIQGLIRYDVEFQKDYLETTDILIESYFRNRLLGEGLQEINSLRLFMKQQGIKEQNYYFAKASLLTAQVILSNVSPDRKKQGEHAYQQAKVSLKPFQDILGENSYLTLMAYKVMGESLYIQGVEQQGEAFKLFFKCFQTPSPLIKLAVLDTLFKLQSPQLTNFIFQFELIDPVEIYIEPQIQLVAKASLFAYYGLQGYPPQEEEKVMQAIITLKKKMSQLFSRVAHLQKGCLIKCGRIPNRQDYGQSAAFVKEFISSTEVRKLKEYEKEKELDQAMQQLDLRIQLQQNKVVHQENQSQMSLAGHVSQEMGTQFKQGLNLPFGLGPEIKSQPQSQVIGVHQMVGQQSIVQQPMGQQTMGQQTQQTQQTMGSQPVGQQATDPQNLGMNPGGKMIGRDPMGRPIIIPDNKASP